jgi:hypothetical protein
MASNESHAQQAKEYFKQQFMNDGATDSQAEAWASGVVGNLMVESTSNINPAAYNSKGGGLGAYGIAQWRADRQLGLKNFASNRGTDASDFQTQLDYVMYEFKNYPSAKTAYAALKQTDNPTDAAKAIEKYYEISKGSALDDRIKYANQVASGTFPAPSWGSSGPPSPLIQIPGAAKCTDCPEGIYIEGINTRQKGYNPIPEQSTNNDSQPLLKTLEETLNTNPYIRYIYRQLLNKSFHPAVNGYCLMYMVPPALSGMSDVSEYINSIGKMVPFFGVDATPPNININVSQTRTISGNFIYATGAEPQGQISINYIDNSDLQIYNLHKIWIDYIRHCVLGDIKPTSEYMPDNKHDEFIYLDYAASIYIIQFKPTIDNNITFISKAVGVFPTSLPDKEIIGRRDSNELVMLPISYECCQYRQYIINSKNNEFKWIYDEFIGLFEEYYK